MPRQQLTEAQITALLDPPTDQRELVRHYTLSAADLAAILRCRGDHNRLGHALMLCYLRYPGRPLKAGERPPRPLLLFIPAICRHFADGQDKIGREKNAPGTDICRKTFECSILYGMIRDYRGAPGAVFKTGALNA